MKSNRTWFLVVIITLAILSLTPTVSAALSEPLPSDWLSWVLSLGSIFFFFVFVLLFIVDFIFTRGTSLIIPKVGGHYRFRRSGFVFDSVNFCGVPFALITIQGKNEHGDPIHKTCVTDVEGLYTSISVPRGEYRLTVSRQGYQFPTNQKKSSFMHIDDFYQGEPIVVTRAEQILDPIIPMDRVNDSADFPHATRSFELALWQHWQTLRRLQAPCEFILLTLSLVGLIFRARLIYLIAAVFYTILVLHRLINLLRRNLLSGQVVDSDNQPVAGAIIEISHDEEDDKREIITVSDKNGEFSVRLAPGQYQAHAKKNGFISVNQARTVNMDEHVVIKNNDERLLLKLMKAPTITEDFFLQDDAAQTDLTPDYRSQS